MREFLLHITCWLFIYIFYLYFLSGEFLLHIPRWLYFSVGSFSYTSHACLIFLWGVSLTHPVLASYLCGEFLLNVRYWLFIWGVSLTHPVLAFYFCGAFVLHIPSWFSPPPPPPPPGWLFFFMRGVSYIPCWLLIHSFISGSFSYTSHAGFIFLWGVSLTHPMLVWCFCGEFLLHIPWWLFF